jgi:hypothetical protein
VGPGANYLRKTGEVRLEAVFPVGPETEPVEVEGHAPGVVGDPQCRHDVLHNLRLLRGAPHPKEFTRAFVRLSPAVVEAKPLGTPSTGSTVNKARTRNNYACASSSLESPPVNWAWNLSPRRFVLWGVRRSLHSQQSKPLDATLSQQGAESQ